MAKKKKTPKQKTCRECERRRGIDKFSRNSKTKDGYRHICTECCGDKINKGKRRKKEAASKAIHATITTIAHSGLMPEVIALARKMADRGVTFVCLDMNRDTITVQRMDESKLSEEVGRSS